MVEVPVPEARYEAIFALKNKLLLFSRPMQGSLERVGWIQPPLRTVSWNAMTSSRTGGKPGSPQWLI